MGEHCFHVLLVGHLIWCTTRESEGEHGDHGARGSSVLRVIGVTKG